VGRSTKAKLKIIVRLQDMASMWEAVFGDMGVALIAIFNSIRALDAKNL
jgi:Cd2+/Zn2+-exporting ATPase